MPRRRDQPHQLERSTGGGISSGVPAIGTRQLIGMLSGGGSSCGQLDQQHQAVVLGLAHAEDAAAADGDAGLLHGAQRVAGGRRRCAS